MKQKEKEVEEEEPDECSLCHPIFCPQDTLIHYPSTCVSVFKVIVPAVDLTKTLYAVLVYPIQATFPFQLILLDFIT
jgi:hypothetical protein